MSINFKKYITAVFIFTTITILFSCTENIPNPNIPDDSSNDNQEQVDLVIDEVIDNNDSYDDDNSPEPEGINRLTGLAIDEETENLRPVAIMFNNLKIATPQAGISHADILYECTVEGAITRLMGVFLDYGNLPQTGSVRSSRDYFIDFAQSHDAIYAHCGGSDSAYSVLKSRKIDNLDGTNDYLPDTYWRDPERRRKMGLEHSTMTDGKALVAGIERKKYNTQAKENFSEPLNFSNDKKMLEGEVANFINVPFSYYATSFFEYDNTLKVYKKGQFDKPHTDENTGETITFKNIILLYAKHSAVAGDTQGRISVDFTGSGKGYYASEGKYIEIVWKKPDRIQPYKLYEADGVTPLLLFPGKSYVGIIPTTTTVSFEEKQ